MTDDILDRIDAAVGCFTCHGYLADDSPSGDFCSAECQAEWHARDVAPLDSYREPWERPWDFPGVGSNVFRHVAGTPRAPRSNHGAPLAVDIVIEPGEFRLPRMTGNLMFDLLALDRAMRAAHTPAQLAACSVRSAQLRDAQLAAWRQMVQAFQPAFEAVARNFAELGRQMIVALDANAGPFAQMRRPIEDTDRRDRREVMERALAAARGRNTGPAWRERAPRRIDARRAR